MLHMTSRHSEGSWIGTTHLMRGVCGEKGCVDGLMHKYGTEWTYKDKQVLHALWHRRTQGERTADLADILEMTPAGLCDLWRQLGYDPEAERRRQKEAEYNTREVYIWRCEGLPYSDICVKIGRQPTQSNRASVMKHLMTWCEHHDLPYPQVDRSIDDSAEDLYRWRKQGVSYRDCAFRLDLEPTDKVINRLTNRLAWWCKKNDLEYPKQNIWRDTKELEKLYELRAKSTTWRECAEELGVEFTTKWRGRMTARLIRYAKREGRPWPLHEAAVPRKSDDG